MRDDRALGRRPFRRATVPGVRHHWHAAPVYPAAGYVAAAQRRGLTTVEFNLEPADNAALFDVAVYGRASETVPRFVDWVLAEGWDAALTQRA